ncbi:MAG: 2Fe-2S iron-sulfur cluster-binding protein [Chlorobiales bacterium]|nr:2Fe-2S iron-sulfur cluster-binding protein [Chlorobiales bacterium]
MNVTINNHSYNAEKGDRLLDIARTNQEHIGYFCGGNSICQTCYVKVLEGSELLSPLSDEEKALLSEKLIHEGTRMACLTTVEQEGTIRVISLVEEIKRAFETNPLELVGYSAKMGWESLVQFPETMRLQAQREFNVWELISDVIGGIGDAFQLVVKALTPLFSGNQESDAAVDAGTCNHVQLSSGCSCNTQKDTPQLTKHIAA